MALVAIIFGASAAELLSAQSNSSSASALAPYHFEVASIKLNRTGGSSDADFLPGGPLQRPKSVGPQDDPNGDDG
jgi:hypothetical protein